MFLNEKISSRLGTQLEIWQKAKMKFEVLINNENVESFISE